MPSSKTSISQTKTKKCDDGSSVIFTRSILLGIDNNNNKHNNKNQKITNSQTIPSNLRALTAAHEMTDGSNLSKAASNGKAPIMVNPAIAGLADVTKDIVRGQAQLKSSKSNKNIEMINLKKSKNSN